MADQEDYMRKYEEEYEQVYGDSNDYNYDINQPAISNYNQDYNAPSTNYNNNQASNYDNYQAPANNYDYSNSYNQPAQA